MELDIAGLDTAGRDELLEQWWLTDAEALLAEAQQERRTAVDPLYDEVAE